MVNVRKFEVADVGRAFSLVGQNDFCNLQLSRVSTSSMNIHNEMPFQVWKCNGCNGVVPAQPPFELHL